MKVLETGKSYLLIIFLTPMLHGPCIIDGSTIDIFQDAGRTKNQVPANLMDETIDDCIMRRRRECTEPIWHTVPYLCGNDKMCLKKFETTIQETKKAVDKNYLVLGVLEELKVNESY